jgi:hypothetical protein
MEFESCPDAVRFPTISPAFPVILSLQFGPNEIASMKLPSHQTIASPETTWTTVTELPPMEVDPEDGPPGAPSKFAPTIKSAGAIRDSRVSMELNCFRRERDIAG